MFLRRETIGAFHIDPEFLTSQITASAHHMMHFVGQRRIGTPYDVLRHHHDTASEHLTPYYVLFSYAVATARSYSTSKFSLYAAPPFPACTHS